MDNNNINNGTDNTGETGYDGGQAQGTGNNPAWNKFLEVVPQDLHEKVTPLLQKWDSGVQDRFNKVHSEYEPWKGLKESGVDPELAQFGVNLVSALQNDPQMVFKALQEHYGFNTPTPPADNSGQGQSEPSPEDQYNSRF